ncbi:hypothetical protein mRhiFer1_009844 [Rhinolophus ferrumequinum]|uniref:Uncharacterized protein n=1 Tax=Rhinolophus ferrumequinum TaxID=59479 RepID=A0A7J7YSB6_RHIFE|nr:hypothetical protein mRhiFer1_009844 [Rhinolophus ferrumequinum]
MSVPSSIYSAMPTRRGEYFSIKSPIMLYYRARYHPLCILLKCYLGLVVRHWLEVSQFSFLSSQLSLHRPTTPLLGFSHARTPCIHYNPGPGTKYPATPMLQHLLKLFNAKPHYSASSFPSHRNGTKGTCP